MEFKQSRTYANLMAAFAGESQARNKYNMYAQVARQQGYQEIGDIFDKTAHNEMAHAKEWLKYLQGGELGQTLANLEDAAAGEHYEWTQMYKQFAEEARAEGYKEIAAKFELVAKVEDEHEKRFNRFINTMNAQQIFKKEQPTQWICRNCGHIHEGPQAPNVCPICAHPQAFFEERVSGCNQ